MTSSAPLQRLFAGAVVACLGGALLVLALALAPIHDAALHLPLVGALLLAALGALSLRHRALGKRLLAASVEREQRFAALLAIAADAYWELDAQFRLTLVSRRDAGGTFVSETPSVPRTPWEMPQLVFDDDALDELRADLEARRRFRERPLRLLARGTVRHLMVSGEPRFDARGAFVGYWGVVHDVSAGVQSGEALRASETRQRELFMRIPSPLVVHRGGRVVDANPAAVALFGYPDVEAMRGADILECYEPGDVRERARQRLALVNRLPPGRGVPQAESRLVAVDGRRLVVRATGVRIELDGAPAVLSIYLDDTERRAAEDALRRSESMLSHLVATSPDLITLTDVAEGRYAMVNDTFTRLTGYTQAEVIGRTSAEVGIWNRPEDRDRLVTALGSQGRVKDLPIEFVGKWGQQLSLLVSAARFVMHGRGYLVINARDVTAAEHARLEREAILENASIGIALTRDRRFLMANPAFDQMFGWHGGALVGQPGRAVWASDADYEQLGHEIGPALARGEQIEVERRMARRDGSTFLCRLLARAVDPTHPSRGGTIWIAEDVTERRRIEQALAKARDDAEAASRAKSAFLANTSHEIRTPLNGLVGLVRLARQPGIDEARRRQYLDQIFDSAETLSTIISDILDLSKIEAGKLHVEAVPFSLHALLDTLHRGYKNIADARALGLELRIDADVPATVLGDPVRVRQIVSNYLANALKFTLRGGVRLAARRAPGDRVRFEVRDSGPGIDPTTRARLFHPFTQGDESTTRRFGGTGLGLSICRQLALLMDGEVGVNSQPGVGSCFWAELPLPATEAPAANSALGPLDGSPLTGAKVLMVEDNPVNMMIAAAMLEQWGAQVTQASNGEQAVEAVRRAEHAGRRFDVVLMDVQMPVMSGYEATRILRREHDRRALPIIALTAAALVSEREAALAAGMNDFLTKPIDAQRLHDTLARVLAPA